MGMKKLINVFFYFFMICVPLFPFKYKFLGMPLSMDFFICGAMIFVSIFLLKKEDFNKLKELYRNYKLFYILNLLFIIMSLLSIIYAKNKSIVISETIRFVEYICLFLIVLLYLEKEVLFTGLDWFKKSMFITAIVGIIQFIFNISNFKTGYGILNRGRVFSTFVNPNYYGAAINLIIFYYIIKLLGDKKSKFRNLIVLLLYVVNLVLTLTRGAWFAFVIGLLIIAILKYKKLLLYVPVFPLILLLVPKMRLRLFSVFDNRVGANTSRLNLWKTGLYMLKENLFTGVGAGNYVYRYHEYVKKYPQLKIKSDVYTAHNSYIKMLAELGIFGGIIFTAIYVMLAYLIYRVYKNSKERELQQISLSLVAFWGAYLFQNFFNNLMFIPQLNVLAWVLTAVIYKLYLIEGREGNVE